MNGRARLEKRLKNGASQRLTAAHENSTIIEENNNEAINGLVDNIEASNNIENTDPDGDSEDSEAIDLVTFEIGSTQKNGTSLWREGFRYTKNNRNSWRCDRWQKCKCPATVHVLRQLDAQYMEGYFLEEEHSHMPNPEKKKPEKKRKQLKTTIHNEPRLKASKMLAQVRKDMTDEEVVELGRDPNIRQMIRRARTRKFGNVDCANPLLIEICDELAIKDGEQIVLYDSRSRRNTDDVVLVFAHPQTLAILSTERKWHCDGTFKAAPQPFVQCFVVGASVRRKMIICCHALLPGKNEMYYREVFEAIKKAIGPNFPDRVMTDFELSELSALRHCFPNTTLSACLFHMGQSLWRKFRELDLHRMMRDETIAHNRANFLCFAQAERTVGEMARITFRSIIALALIPMDQVRRAFCQITSFAPPGMQRYLQYFCKTYIGLTQLELDVGEAAFSGDPITFAPRSNNSFGTSQPSSSANHSLSIPILNFTNSQSSIHQDLSSSQPADSTIHSQVVLRWEMTIVKRPLFPIDLWNVHLRAQGALARTNNSLEATHKHFTQELRHHPCLSEFILALHEDIDKQIDINRSVRLKTATNRRKRHILHENNIRETLQEANFADDNNVVGHLYDLGLQLKGYVSQLYTCRAPVNEDESMNESNL